MSQNEDPKSVYIFPEDSPVTPSIYDTRVRHLYLKKGIVSEEKLKNHLESLEDCSDLAESQNFLEVVSDLSAAEAEKDLVEEQSSAAHVDTSSTSGAFPGGMSLSLIHI